MMNERSFVGTFTTVDKIDKINNMNLFLDLGGKDKTGEKVVKSPFFKKKKSKTSSYTKPHTKKKKKRKKKNKKKSSFYCEEPSFKCSDGADWDEEEDKKLRLLIIKKGEHHFHSFKESFRNRRTKQLKKRWREIKELRIKGPWCNEEDLKLRVLVKKYGAKKWSQIAKEIPGRIGKQCRERWHNHLDPKVNKNPWSATEEEIILECQEKMGNKWALIAKQLKGRTDNMIKNHWNSTLKKRQEERLKRKGYKKKKRKRILQVKKRDSHPRKKKQQRSRERTPSPPKINKVLKLKRISPPASNTRSKINILSRRERKGFRKFVLNPENRTNGINSFVEVGNRSSAEQKKTDAPNEKSKIVRPDNPMDDDSTLPGDEDDSRFHTPTKKHPPAPEDFLMRGAFSPPTKFDLREGTPSPHKPPFDDMKTVPRLSHPLDDDSLYMTPNDRLRKRKREGVVTPGIENRQHCSMYYSPNIHPYELPRKKQKRTHERVIEDDDSSTGHPLLDSYLRDVGGTENELFQITLIGPTMDKTGFANFGPIMKGTGSSALGTLLGNSPLLKGPLGSSSISLTKNRREYNPFGLTEGGLMEDHDGSQFAREFPSPKWNRKL